DSRAIAEEREQQLARFTLVVEPAADRDCFAGVVADFGDGCGRCLSEFCFGAQKFLADSFSAWRRAASLLLLPYRASARPRAVSAQRSAERRRQFPALAAAPVAQRAGDQRLHPSQWSRRRAIDA